MKKALIGALTVIFVFVAILATAEEKCTKPCPAGSMKSTEKAQAGCAMDAKAASDKAASGCCAKSAKATATSASAMSAGEGVREEVKKEAPDASGAALLGAQLPDKAAEKIAEGSCPEVSDRAALENFHNTMHPMHMALEESKYDEIRTLMPAMDKSTKDLKAYKCPMGDNCPPECKKDFDSKKSALLKSVKKLKKACSKKDNAKLEAAFMTVHENYLKFAGMCDMKNSDDKRMEKKTSDQ